MSKKYYVYFGQMKVGHFTGSQLVVMAKERAIKPNTIIEQVDTGKTISAGELKSLPFPIAEQKKKDLSDYAAKYSAWFLPVTILMILLSSALGGFIGWLIK